MIKLLDLFKYITFFTFVVLSNCKISDKRLCADPQCKTQISSGVTKIIYNSPDTDILSFRGNVPVKIFSKSAGSNPDLWGVNIQNREGYVPFRFIQEKKVFVGKNELKYIVSTKTEPSSTDETKLKSSESEKEDILSATTTVPLTIDVQTEIVTKEDALNSSGELPVEASAVQTKGEVIDGTLLPFNTENSNSLETPKTTADNVEVTTEKVSFDDIPEVPLVTKNTEDDVKKSSPENENESDDDYVTIQDFNDETTTLKLSSSNNRKLLINDEEDDEIQYDDDDYVEEDDSEEDNDLKPKSKIHLGEDSNEKLVKAEQNESVAQNKESTSLPIEKSSDSIESRFNSPDNNITDESSNVSSQELETNISHEELVNSEVVSKNVYSEVPQNLQVPDMSTNTVSSNGESKKDEPDISKNSMMPKNDEVPQSQVSEKSILSNIEIEINVEPSSNIIAENKISEENIYNQQDQQQSANDQVAQNNIFEKNTSDLTPNSESKILESKIVLGSNDSLVLANNSNQDEQTQDSESNTPKNGIETISPHSTDFSKDAVNVSESDVEPQLKHSELHVMKDSSDSQKQTPPISNPIQNSMNGEDLLTEISKTIEKPSHETIHEPNQKILEKESEIVNKNEKVPPNESERMPENSPELKPYQMNVDESIQNEKPNEVKQPPEPPVQDPYRYNEIIPTTPGYDDSIDENMILDTTTANPKSSLPFRNKLPEVSSTTELPSSLPLTENYSPNIPDIPQTQTKESKIEAEVIVENPTVYLSDNKVEENTGLFATILETVKSVWSASGNDKLDEKVPDNIDIDLSKILYPSKHKTSSDDQILSQTKNKLDANEGFCDQVSPYDCPKSVLNAPQGLSSSSISENCVYSAVDILDILINKLLEMFDLLICMGIAAATSLLFCFGYYCICHSRKERTLLSKLNIVERNFLASIKETSILKHELAEYKTKLVNIENNSFGSNDMVIALKKDLEILEEDKQKLVEQVSSLEKELETAAEAGLELNKIVSELLNNQSGDESIISSVEELQKQLNDQQNTILEINAILADKSRENSELQLILAENRARLEGEIESLKQDNEELENEKTSIQNRLDGIQNELESELNKALDVKNNEIKSLQQDNSHWQTKYDEVYTKWQSSMAKIKGFEEYLDVLKENSTVNMTAFMEVAGKKVDLVAVEKERDIYKERYEELSEMKKLLENQLKIIRDEMEKLKQECNQNEKDKLEAQTRLEVLSNYFRDKETQLQKELSVKEAMWMKQQGETTSHVDRVRNMQEEIQSLRSQNDSLRAEIEAQNAAHKAQIGTLENRAHETWLAARQSERKFEEARSEAASFRRKLTSLAGNANNLDLSRLPNSGVDGLLPNDLNNAPSPIHMESPGASILGVLPPPPVLPPPFMVPPPPHFMPMPPFMPPVPGEMRPPPVGRLMSPPPPLRHHGRYSPSIIDDDDDDDDHRDPRHNHHHHSRGRYSPRNGRYSPDDRYDDDKYNTEITYDTETDFSPPPSPHSRGGGGYDRRDRDRDRDREHDREHRNRGSRAGSFKAFSPPPPTAPTQSSSTNSNSQDRNKRTNKGILSSGSEQSYDSRKGKGLV